MQAPHPVHVIPKIPVELLERPVTLRQGIGQIHHDATAESAEAQRFYDQGLAYLHSYVWIEAARSFHQALRADATLALAHIGLSYAYVELNQPAAARAVLDRAQALASSASDHVRRHVEIRRLQLAAEDAPRDAAKLAAYRQALDEALTAFPLDAEFILQRGVAASDDPADRGQGGTAASIPYYQKVLVLDGDHFAAHHYLTHALENNGKALEALEHGRAYARLAAAIPHARHMHGHSLRRVGRIDEAVGEFEAADRLHRTYFAAERLPPEYDWHHHHNLDLLASSYQYLGKMKQAETMRKAGFALPSNLVAQLFNKREWPAFLRSRGRLEEAFTAAQVLMAHPHPLIQATGHIEAGYAVLGAGRFADAAGAFNAALRLLRDGPEGAPMAANVLLGLQGEISLRTAQREKAREVFADVARRLRTATGPDAWSRALVTLEALARTARAVGDWKLAGDMALQMLDHDPAYAGSHYARALVAEYDGDSRTAREEFELALKYWSKADPDLPELRDIRMRLEKLR